jgi:hypothetical protein
MFLTNFIWLDRKYTNCDVVLYTCIIIYTLNHRSIMAFFKNIFFEKPEILGKHKIYKSQYKTGELYWGLGIENEVYLEFEKKTSVSKRDFLTKHKEERYSVDYFSNYKPEYLKTAMKEFASTISTDEIEVPILLKSHSFSKTDVKNEAVTICTKESKMNPKFSGKTFLETLQDANRYFKDSYDIKWMFDGDVFEFPTRKFYKVLLDDVLNELSTAKQEFIEHLNNVCEKEKIFQEYGQIKIMEKNHAFAKYMTNFKNVAMFNNGTLHYNITLPTELDSLGTIKNREEFVKNHRKAIKAIQWVEPFLIGLYGSPDPFYQISSDLFSAASQRCAISRYIGLGTYDTDAMNCGKILTRYLDEIEFSKNEYWWFHQYYKENGYVKLDEIGMDINFNKHYNHGIEIRFLDHLSDEKDIAETFEFLIYLMDFALESDWILSYENPGTSCLWNGLLVNVMKQGQNYVLSEEEAGFFGDMFSMEKPFLTNGLRDVFDGIFNQLIRRYTSLDVDMNVQYIGEFSSVTLKNEYKNAKSVSMMESIMGCCPF